VIADRTAATKNSLLRDLCFNAIH